LLAAVPSQCRVKLPAAIVNGIREGVSIMTAHGGGKNLIICKDMNWAMHISQLQKLTAVSPIHRTVAPTVIKYCM